MKFTSLYILAIFIVLFNGCKSGNVNDYPIQPVSFTQVHFSDSFWLPKMEVNRTVSIPSAFEQCRINGRFDNFALAGGLITGEHKGDYPFDDTDVYKIIEGASYSLSVHYDAHLDHYLDSIITLIAAGQEKDGYIYTCRTNNCERLRGWMGSKRWENINSHELYNVGHLIEAAVAHHAATGKNELLNVAIKAADRVYADFGPDSTKIHQPGGHPIVEMALVKLYRATNNEKYLNLAQYFIDETGRCSDGHKPNPYSQDHKPIAQQTEAVGHAVRFGYLYSGVADVASIRNIETYKIAGRNVWENVVSKKLYITGGIGATGQGEGFLDNYQLPNLTAYCETCAAISNVYWNYRLFLQNGDSKYIDVLERALYNGVISGVSVSGDKFFYDNPLASDHNHLRKEWFGCACCPGNITRFMASVPGYQYAVSGKQVFVNLYVQGKANIRIGNDSVELIQNTRYPWDGEISLTINAKESGSFALKLRVPGWTQNKPVPSDLYYFKNESAQKPVLLVNGKAIEYLFENGYATISRKWQSGDQVSMTLEMPVSRVYAIDSVMADQGKVALQRGPLVYCLEGKDQPTQSTFDLYIADSAKLSIVKKDSIFGGIPVITWTASQLRKDGVKDLSFNAIPYYLWNNRGKDEMSVWVNASQGPVVLREKNPIASSSKFKASNQWFEDGPMDGFIPKNSADVSASYFYWWHPSGDQVEWAEYTFDKPYTISQSAIYWLVMNHYEQNFQVPASWQLFYKKGDQWLPVETTSEYGVNKDMFNPVTFNPVKTQALRLEVKLQPGFSGGMHEWTVN